MEENKEDQLDQTTKIENLIKTINKLPVKLQNAIFWAIEYFDQLEVMGKNSEMTFEEIQSAKEEALAEENYATLILLYITEHIKQTTENEEI